MNVVRIEFRDGTHHSIENAQLDVARSYNGTPVEYVVTFKGGHVRVPASSVNMVGSEEKPDA